jgi:flagellar basal-body rod protein FlgB
MDEISATIIKTALDGLATRQAYAAQNVANASSPNYVPVEVRFEEELAAAASQGMEVIRSVKPEISKRSDSVLSSELRLDLELATAAQTAMRYGALVDVMGRQMSLTMSVIRGGQ